MNTQPTPTQATHNVYWITDPGHAWLAVSLEAYPDAINYGTGYGYQDRTHIYLEQDLEAPAFLDDHPPIARHSVDGQLAVRHYDFDAPTRRLQRNEDRLDVEAFYARRRAAREAVQA